MDLYQDCSYDAPGVKTGPARGGGVFHKFESLKHRDKEGKLQHFSSLKLEGAELWYFYVASPSGPLPKLFIWCLWGQIGPRPGGHKFETYEQRRKTLKFFFSETRRSRALIIWPWTMIFGAISILFIWYPWGQNWPHPGDHKLEQ